MTQTETRPQHDLKSTLTAEQLEAIDTAATPVEFKLTQYEAETTDYRVGDYVIVTALDEAVFIGHIVGFYMFDQCLTVELD